MIYGVWFGLMGVFLQVPLRYLQQALNLSITLGINKVVTLTFEGTLVVKASFFLQWTDPLRRWLRDTPYNWRFPKWIILSANEIWHPRCALHKQVVADFIVI